MKRDLLFIFFGFMAGTLALNYLIISYLLGSNISQAYFFSVLVPGSILSALFFTLWARYWRKRKSRKNKET